MFPGLYPRPFSWVARHESLIPLIGGEGHPSQWNINVCGWIHPRAASPVFPTPGDLPTGDHDILRV